ncbi:UDP-2,3-diacylglucosamine diphosphatase [Arcticibacter tournemirensis]|uniref:UDP-2,3-diacylglucosamine diphosphatase n=1 Tax=Arcticibacter tournemirensis TaxID=699437 RepID=A0A4Q0ME41_9SPHI|nr:UDP-2,3-diacylglucosamine diphosphatase [Arcticibacter tournemirensis]RXF71711.1 UDP-2,3-diacylglucosamine diphosphatase [Arcticibacter tournemirensis]
MAEERNKIYFASDFHLGVPDYSKSRQREALIVQWLDSIKEDAAELYLVGDIFDFWFEYKKAVPRGFIRFLGKLAELSDKGVKITMFKGNHDMWMFGYLTQEMGVTIVSDELIIDRRGKKFYIHHGDGLGPGDAKYKILKKIFRSSICQWLFARIHPNLGMAIALGWSGHSRLKNMKKEVFLGEDREWLVDYSKKILQKEHFDYFIYGHRHLPLDIKLGESSRYINLGEWINYYSYAVFDGNELKLQYYKTT